MFVTAKLAFLGGIIGQISEKKSLHCMDDLTTLHTCFSCFREIFILLISWSNHLISSRRSIQVFYGCILLPHKRHLVVLVILCTYNSHLQIQNKCRLNKMSQVWCRKGSLWKVRFIFEITNISICAAWRVVVRLVVSILNSSFLLSILPNLPSRGITLILFLSLLFPLLSL